MWFGIRIPGDYSCRLKTGDCHLTGLCRILWVRSKSYVPPHSGGGDHTDMDSRRQRSWGLPYILVCPPQQVPCWDPPVSVSSFTSQVSMFSTAMAVRDRFWETGSHKSGSQHSEKSSWQTGACAASRMFYFYTHPHRRLNDTLGEFGLRARGASRNTLGANGLGPWELNTSLSITEPFLQPQILRLLETLINFSSLNSAFTGYAVYTIPLSGCAFIL